MGLTELIFGITPAAIATAVDGEPPFVGVITLDACIHENHRAAAKATRHPIEGEVGGSKFVSDHAEVEPLSLQIEGMVSNYPAEFLATAVYMGQDRAQDAYDELLHKIVGRQLCTIVTSLKTYDNMLLELLEVPRDAANANVLHFNATATQVSLIHLKGELGKVTGTTENGGAMKAQPASAGSAAKVQSALSKLTGMR